MMKKPLTDLASRFKPFLFAAGIITLAACSTNPATGERQFAGLMSPAQEVSVGASEHEKVLQEFGAPKAGDPLQAYVESVGRKVAANTERKDVEYKFFLLDTPMLNAFALPGGYVYVTRGILAQANSEAELAAVLAHEIGHITARHSAERYSHGVLSSLGAAVLGAATNNSQLGQAASLGSNLYISSYSRSQESQADELGIRYLSRAGYDPMGMAGFLESLSAHDALESAKGRRGQETALSGYFSSHPRTTDRVTQAIALAGQYPKANHVDGHNEYLGRIDGMVYGDSAQQGFIRGQRFWHPAMGFTFEVPQGFEIENQPAQVVALNQRTGAALIFDAAQSNAADPAAYIAQEWMKGEPAGTIERITINGKPAATATFPGQVNNSPANIRIVAVKWDADTMFRFQIAIPPNASTAQVNELKEATYSLRAMTGAEKNNLQPLRLRAVTAGSNDTIASLSSRMAVEGYREEEFRALNALDAGEKIIPGRKYKIVTQ